MSDLELPAGSPALSEFERFRLDIKLATDAEQRRDFEEAARIWQRIAASRPDEPKFIPVLVANLKRSNQMAAAEALIDGALQRFPTNFAITLEAGWLAAHQRDWPEALLRWKTALTKFPHEPALHAAIGTALAATGEYEDAESFLSAAVSLFPTDVQIATEYASIAARLDRWDDAVIRWKNVIERFPGRPDALARLGGSQAKAGDLVAAERTLLQAEDAFPESWAIAVERAQIAEADPAEAVERWRRVHGRFPALALACSGLGRALRRVGQFEAAETVLGAGRTRFPDDLHIVHEYATTSGDRQNWEEAATRWKVALKINPQDVGARHHLSQALLEANLAAMMMAPPVIGARQRPPVVPGGEADPADIMKLFESLGENCEFGLVQRYFGIEPLGLLRFSGMPTVNLRAALEIDFDGIGDPAHTALVDTKTEYVTTDKRFGLTAHTFINPKTISYADCLAQQCQRLSYLKNRLIEDLEDAHKVFVVIAVTDPSDDDAQSIHDLLRKYGQTRLLYVRAEIPDINPGTVTEASEGLYFGYLDRYGNRGQGRGWDISNEVWLEVCKKTLDLIARVK